MNAMQIVGPLYRLVCWCLLAIHVALVGVMVWWAGILAAPIETFGTSQTYWYFRTHWPYTERGWAGLFLLAGMVGLPGVWPVYGKPYNQRITYMRILSAGGLAAAHGWLAYVLAESNPGTTGTGTYAIFAALGVFRIVCEVRMVVLVLEAGA